MGEHRLHTVPVQDVLFGAGYRTFEALFCKAGNEMRFVYGAGSVLRTVRQAFAYPRNQFLQTPAPAGIGASVGRINMNDDIEPAAQIVEYHHFVGNKQQDIRRINRVWIGAVCQFWLDIAYRVVAEVADQAAGESGQVGMRGHPVAVLELVDV